MLIDDTSVNFVSSAANTFEFLHTCRCTLKEKLEKKMQG